MNQKEAQTELNRWMKLQNRAGKLRKKESYVSVKCELSKIDREAKKLRDKLMDYIKANKTGIVKDDKTIIYKKKIGLHMANAKWQYRPAQDEGSSRSLNVTKL